MADIYDNLLAELENVDAVDPAAVLAAVAAEAAVIAAAEAVAAEIKKIPTDTKKSAKKTPKRPVDVGTCDLVKSADEFMTPLFKCSDEMLSDPVATTITLSGYLTGVSMHERDLIECVEPVDNVVMLDCNYGTKATDEYLALLNIKKSNRGRKKMEKKKKPRKTQGTGRCFASQLTFVVRQTVPMCATKSATYYEFYSQAHDTTPINIYFKIKVFRNGVVQIPGARPDLLPYIISSINKIVECLNKSLNSDKYRGIIEGRGETFAAATVGVGTLYPVMIDYKFYMPLEARQMLDLKMLLLIFTIDKLRQTNTLYVEGEINSDEINARMDGGMDYTEAAKEVEQYMKSIPRRECPPIVDVKYTSEETKLAIIFSTPLPHKRDKITRVNVFLGGEISPGNARRGAIYGAKIDILGALDRAITRDIYEYLLDIFERYGDLVVVAPTDDDNEYIIVDDMSPYNIEHVETPLETYTALKKEHCESVTRDASPVSVPCVDYTLHDLFVN